MSHVLKAQELHQNGYNCAQAVICAFSDKVDLPLDVLYRISEGYGSGMGNMQGTCGALSGAVAILGLVNSNGNTEFSGPKSKAVTYSAVRNIMNRFNEERGTVRCMDLKNRNADTFTPCSKCVELAARLLEEELEKSLPNE